MGPDDTSDAQWKLIEPLLPEANAAGSGADHRLMFDGILWVLRTGSPGGICPSGTGYRASVPASAAGRRTARSAHPEALRIRTDKQGYIDWDLWCVDGSNVRASRAAAQGLKSEGEPRDHARVAREASGDQGFHLVVGHAIPLAAVVGGASSRSTKFIQADGEGAAHAARDRWPLQTAGDKGYSYPRVREWLERRGIEAVIPSAAIRSDGGPAEAGPQGLPPPLPGREQRGLAQGRLAVWAPATTSWRAVFWPSSISPSSGGTSGFLPLTIRRADLVRGCGQRSPISRLSIEAKPNAPQPPCTFRRTRAAGRGTLLWGLRRPNHNIEGQAASGPMVDNRLNCVVVALSRRFEATEGTKENS